MMNQKWVGCALFLLLLLAPIVFADDAVTVRVGVYNNPPKIFVEDGVVKGFWADVTNYLAEQEDWNVEYVFGTWNECLGRLDNNKIDMLVDVAVTLDRRKKYAFPDEVVLSSWTELYVSNGTVIETFRDLEGKRIGVLKGSANYIGEGGIKEVLDSFGINVEFVEFDSYDNAFSATMYGLVDAAVTNMAFGGFNAQRYGLKKTPVMFRPSEISYAFPKEGALTEYLIEAINYYFPPIKADPGSIYNKSFNKYFFNFKGEQIFELTGEEEAWLAEHKDIRLGVDPSWPPFEFIDDLGAYRGMCSDYVAEVESMLGVTMLPQKDLAQGGMIEKARAGEIDVIPCIESTDELAEYLLFTKPYAAFPIVLVTRDDTGFISSLSEMEGKKVAVIRGLANEGLLARDYPGIIRVPADSFEDSLLAVSEGKADGAIGTFASIEYTAKKLGIKNLQISATTPYTIELSFGVRKDWPEMVGILDRALTAIPDDRFLAINDKWTALMVETVINWNTVWFVAVSISGIAIIIFGLFLLWNRSMAREIIKRKRLERALRRSEESYRAIFNSSKDGIVVFSIKTQRGVDANVAACNLLGYSKEEFMSRQVPDVTASLKNGKEEMSKKQVRSIITKLALQVVKKGSLKVEWNLRHKTGRIIPAEVNLSIVSINGKLRVLAIIRDISERKEIDRMKDDIISIASHELKTPLTSTISILQTLLGKKLGKINKKQEKYLRLVLNDSCRLDGIIQNMLDISRIEGNRISYSKEKYDLNKAVKADIAIAKNLAKKRGIQIIMEKKGSFQVRADKARIDQVILNLLTNAVKYGKKDGHIWVSLRKKGRNAVLEVRDDGVGISKENISKLFEKMFQVSRGAQRVAGGVGFGLYISRKIVEGGHGGRIWVESELGKGSTFYVSLPLNSSKK